MTGVHVPWTPKVGDVVEVRFNQPDVRRAPWWELPYRATAVVDTPHGPLVAAVAVLPDGGDDDHPVALWPGHDHVLRLAGQVEGQQTLELTP